MSMCTLRDWDAGSLSQMFALLIGETNAVLAEALNHARFCCVSGSTLIYHFSVDNLIWYNLASASYNRRYLDDKIRWAVPEASVWCVLDGAEAAAPVGPPEALA